MPFPKSSGHVTFRPGFPNVHIDQRGTGEYIHRGPDMKGNIWETPIH